MATNGKLQAALEYHKRGRSVIPVKLDKTPYIKWKLYTQELPNEDEIRCWWDQFPDANIGLVCGKVSDGLAVLDVDDVGLAGELLKTDLCDITTIVKTPSGGLQRALFTPSSAYAIVSESSPRLRREPATLANVLLRLPSVIGPSLKS